MKEKGASDVFTDLIEGGDELQSFLDQLQEQLPAAVIQLHADSGSVLPGHAPLGFAEGELFTRIDRESGGISIEKKQDNLYTVEVPQLAAFLLIQLPDADAGFTVIPDFFAFLRNNIDLALGRQAQEKLKLENQQIQRQIEVLSRQHHKLIEDNYRQYCLIREREKGYARELEKAIARQTAELREANAKLEEGSRHKSEFLANMSHELRTPLNAIIGFSELLVDDGLTGEQEEYGNTIRSAAHTLLALVNDILDLAKIEAGKIDLENEIFELTGLLDTVAGMFRLRAGEKGVAFCLRSDDRLPSSLLGDANRLQQVLLNLVGNALKFTSKGSVELSAELAGTVGENVMVRFTVKDTGIGIPAERQQAIFEKFTQADGSTTRKYGGTGLGLAICRQLIELMKGEIFLESIPGEGSTFYFTVPLAVAPSAGRGEQAAKAAGVRTGEDSRALVLLAEDNPVNQRLASILIRKLNHEVVVAANGLEVLEALKAHPCDLILMDIQMPLLDGLAAARKIRALEALPGRDEYAGLRGRTGPIPIIGLTAHVRKEDEQASLQAGMDGFLTKPIVRDKLAVVLKKHLACEGSEK